jgi:hypothetical protein
MSDSSKHLLLDSHRGPNPPRKSYPQEANRSRKIIRVAPKEVVLRSKTSPDNNPILLLKEALLRISDLESEVANLKAQLDIPGPVSTRAAETANKIAYLKAVEQLKAGDRKALHRFLASGGKVPKLLPIICNLRHKSGGVKGNTENNVTFRDKRAEGGAE